MKNHLRTSLTFLTFAALLLAGCRAKTSLPGAGNDGAPEIPIVAPSPQPTPAVLRVSARSTKQKWKVGTPVQLEIEVKNLSKRPVTLQFSSGQSFNFSATRAGETEPAWNWAMDKMFITVMRSQTLNAGQSLKFSATWENAAPGRYSVTGTLTTIESINAAPFWVEIAP